PMKHAIPASIALRGFHPKLAGRECEKIRRNGLCFRVTDSHAALRRFVERLGAVRNRLPVLGDVQLERETRLQVWLIEARKRKMRARRHEQRVQEIGIAVE